MKKILIFSVLVFIGLLLAGSLLAYNYFKPNIIKLENLNQSILEGKDINNPNDLIGIIDEVQKKQVFPANPRIKVFYQGVEVAYIDHLGNIYGSSGWFTNINASTTNSTVFYEAGNRLALNSTFSVYYTGSQTNSFYLNKSGDKMSGNLNMSNYNVTGINCLIGTNGGTWCFT